MAEYVRRDTLRQASLGRRALQCIPRNLGTYRRAT